MFRVSALGGEPSFLGCCEGSLVGKSDTVLLLRQPQVGDSTATIAWMSISDGLTHDSVLVPHRDGALDAEPFPDGRYFVLERKAVGSSRVVVYSRRGVAVDSLNLDEPLFFADVSPGGAMLAVVSPYPRSADCVILGYPVDSRGHISPKPDTVIRQISMNGGGSTSSTGAIVYGAGPTDYSVWSLSRENATSVRFHQRKLAGATANTAGTLSPSGDRVLLWRDVLVGDRRLTQLSVMPFDSGPEVRLGQARDYVDKDWSGDGQSILVGMHQGDSIVVSRLDANSDRSTHLATYPSSAYRFLETLPQGGYVLIVSARDFRTVGASGLKDTTYQLPSDAGTIFSVDPSPDGKAMVEVGWNRSSDSILVNRISLTDGSVVRLAALVGEDATPPRWLADGSLAISILETSRTLAWYRVPSTGGPAVRLGAAPRFPATYRFSQDGRHVLMIAEDQRSDIYLMRNFGDAFKQ
jgi:hypothetical protein